MTGEDLRYAIQKSYSNYTDEELYRLVLIGHYDCGTRRRCNEGFYAAEELIERLQNRVNKTPQEK